jgi:hypothetical protein
MRQTRRGDSVLEFIGGIVVLLVIGGVIWWFVTGKNPLKEKRVDEAIHTVLPERPKPVVLMHRYDYHLLDDSNHIVTVQNVGGAGKVRVTSRLYRDKAETKFIRSFSRVAHLEKGQQQEVVIRLYGVKEGLSGVYARASADPE